MHLERCGERDIRDVWVKLLDKKVAKVTVTKILFHFPLVVLTSHFRVRSMVHFELIFTHGT